MLTGQETYGQREKGRDSKGLIPQSLSPAEEATAQREDSSGAEESEPAPKRQREKQQDISMLMAFDEDQQTEDEKNEMKTYLEDRTKVDKGPLIWWKINEERYPKLARAAKRIHAIGAHIFKSRLHCEQDTELTSPEQHRQTRVLVS
ncbi:hypothetical protein NQZ68_031166 [Dissostichus eleginoides]|nr:hypothetical protein NQZ68_031166 [Dissostichus eleginoides]